MQKAKIIFHQTVMISAAILFGIGVQMILQHYIEGAESLTLSWNVPISICFTGFLCSLPTYFLLDLDSLKKNVMWMRIVIHFISVVTAWIAKSDEIKINTAIKDIQDSE